MVIDSPEVAHTLSSISRGNLLKVAYELRLSPDGSAIVWISRDESGREVVHDSEPHSTWWTRLKLGLLLPWLNKDEL
ncbi:hypothetical protein QTH97_06860 [Variovorax sp. J22R24]|uniref:hypothetical protein n=1 Tax=Variovorax gracilis TaxID=3053502 RepID=UPI0025755805|nr:hypothetical protein [Variovorax sp. J22R24]MDM0104644.1 hypothetical protein [Variovorax sp. J22R24]